MKMRREGFCYVDLFGVSYQEDVATLGLKPTVAALRRFVNSHANCLAEGRFRLSLAADGSGVVGHVQVLDPDAEASGIRAHEVLFACSKELRLGSAGTVSVVRDSTSNEAAGGNPISMDVVPKAAVHKIALPIGGYLNTENNYMVLNPASVKGLARTFSLFESVRLGAFSITVTVQGDVSTVARFAATISQYPPNTNGAWATAEASMTMTGNNTGATVNEFTLPPDHQFGRELKGVALSNRPPIFHFYVTSSVPCHVWYRGHMMIEFSGQGNPKGVDLSAEAQKMGVAHPSCTISPGLGHGLIVEDSDDDEPERVVSPALGRGGGKASEIIRR